MKIQIKVKNKSPTIPVSHKTVSFAQRTVVLGSKGKQALEELPGTVKTQLRAPPNSKVTVEPGAGRCSVSRTVCGSAQLQSCPAYGSKQVDSIS